MSSAWRPSDRTRCWNCRHSSSSPRGSLVLYAGLGLLAAVVGVAFTKALYGLEDVVDRIWRGPEWLRPGAGGIVLGLLLAALPAMYGVGYPVLERAIGGSYGSWMLLVLLAGKILATSLTIAIGGSGSVFAPSLFMGAMLGTAFGQSVHHLLPGIATHPGAYGLVGMGAVFAAAARAPMTAAGRFDAPLAAVIDRFTRERREALPVVDAEGRYRGTITAREVEQAMRDNALDAGVGSLAEMTPTVRSVKRSRAR